MNLFRHHLRERGSLLVLLGLVVLFSCAGDGFASADNLLSVLETSAIPSIAAVGLTFVMLQGSIDLSIEGIASLACILTGLYVANSITGHHNLPVALIVALGAGLLFGPFNGLMYAKLRIPSLIVTLGTWFVAGGLATYLFPSRQPQITDDAFLSIALTKHFGLSGIVYVAVFVIAVAYVIQTRTRVGRLSFGIGADERLVRLAGLKVERIKLVVFAMSGFLSALCGLLLAAQLGVGNPRAGDGLLFPAVSAAVIGGTLLSGGRGGVLQTLTGVLILSVLRNGLLQVGMDPLLIQIVEGATIVLAVVAGSWHLRAKLRVAK
ncbi:sugar ABC transporter permease (plasmid) [Paraburkholderia sp. PGU19]|uniref:ABC transporter permease n=1 Tax=Paraburkholderia sp. PGU19 TaxID=2735434 RepID=UPI0015DB0DDC|nr:ABC transporter permease [Paraburkholderia sp. PGU19]BCG04491.1 sugar ABC transporter permease [Paraburkholderia sp. PGU19]